MPSLSLKIRLFCFSKFRSMFIFSLVMERNWPLSKVICCSTLTATTTFTNSDRGLHLADCGRLVKDTKKHIAFLISNFRCVPNVVCFLLGNFPASEFYMSTFRNTLFHLHRKVGTWLWRWKRQSVPKRRHIIFSRRGIAQKKAARYLPMKMEQTECSETSAYKIQTPGNYPEEKIPQLIFSL